MDQFPTDGKCQRCGNDAQVTSMSYFNTDYCCMPCLAIEKKHPDYSKARDAEWEAIKQDNYNYQGIGLPAGYHEWARAQT